VAPVRDAVTSVDPDLPFYLPQTMQSRIDETLQGRRAPMVMLLVFAAVALFLAAIGIYGVLAYTVSQRTRELGVRMALGGRPTQIFAMVVRQGGVVIGIGLAIGLVTSLALVRLIRTLLFGVEPADPVVLAAVIGILAAVGALACVLPARRATRLDPVEALASE
jgi:putative ABC transport system permease protein